jgi:DNA-3-methyladenine glycosylase I
MNRCSWASSEPEITYHDQEWGVPVHDERILFEFLILEGAQAGLSWSTILKKREGYRRAFAGFDPEKIAGFTAADVNCLMNDSGIVRNRLKIEGTIKNAKAFLTMRDSGLSPSEFLWDFVDGKSIDKQRVEISQVPASSPESDAMSRALKKRGFTFVGSTICYAFMQAVGMVNDHLVSCPRHAAVRKLAEKT